MAFCTKCGNKLKNGAKFCSQCGTKVIENSLNSTNIANNKQNLKQNYSMYETFKSSSIFFKAFDNILKSDTRKTTYNFTITDKSIIMEGIEHPYSELTVIHPTGSFREDLLEPVHGTIETNINRITYVFNYNVDQRERFFYAVILANQNIELSSCRQKLLYILMMYAYLYEAERIIRKMPFVSYDDNNFFTEYSFCNKYLVINSQAHISENNLRIISNYQYVQELLNRFYKEEHPIANAGYNRAPSTLASIVKLMSDTDTDMNEIINRYNSNLEWEKFRMEAEQEARNRQRAMQQSNTSSNNGFISNTISTAAGVAIGNKISNRKNNKNSEKAYYMCHVGCKFKYREHGCDRCKLSTDWLNSPEPEKCGHGYRYK